MRTSDDRLRSLTFKLYGEPPPRAPRAFSCFAGYAASISGAAVTLAVYALAYLAVADLDLRLLAAFALIWLQSVISLCVRIRREARARLVLSASAAKSGALATAERRARVAGATAGVEPLMPTVETSPAAHIAAIVSARRRLGVSQPNWWFCSQLLKPVAAEAAAIAHPAHIGAA